MASAATLELIIKLNNKSKAGMKGFEKSIKSSSKALKDARSGLDKMGDAAKRNRTKLLAIGAGVAAIGVLSIKSAADFQKGMAEVNTLLNVSQKQINALGDDVRGLSKEFGINAVDATKALYQTISAGIEPAKALEFLGVAAKTSIGGITDLETAVDGLTTVVNAFGFDASESEHVADILFETMRRGKCLTGDTRVLLADGRYERIDHLIDEAEIVSYDGRAFTPMQAAWIDQGEKPTVQVTTRLGRTIKTTWEHPYLTPDGWRKVSELQVGDRIAVPTTLPYFGHVKVDEAEASLLGLWIAEGSTRSGSPRITSTTYGEEISVWAAELGCATKNIEKRLGYAPIWEMTAGPRGGIPNPNPILGMLHRYSLNKVNSAGKHVPRQVFSWRRKHVATFLRWLFNGDGWLCDIRLQGRSGFDLGFCSMSELLVRDVSHLLLRFGIVGTIRSRGNAWIWQTRRYFDVERFVRFIGIDRPAASDVGKHVPGNQKKHDAVIEFTPIDAIEARGTEHVYDLVVPDLRNFVAEDIVAHNTTIGELSDFMFQAAPVSAALGVSFEEMTASVATLTKQGTPTRVAMTGIRQAIISLAKPTEDMSRLLQIMGFESGLAAIETLGLQGTFEALATKTGATESELVKAVGSVESLTTVLGLTGKNAEVFREDLEAITNSAGAMKDGFEIMADTTSQKFAEMQAAMNDVKIQIGEELLPIVTSLADKLTTAANAFGKLPDPAKTAAVSVGGAAGAIVALGLILPPFIVGWGKILKVFAATKGAVAVAIGALGTATAAVLGGFGLAAAGILFFTRNAATSKDVLADFRAMVAEVAEKTLVKIEDQLRQVAFGFNDLKGVAGTTADEIVKSSDKMADAFADIARKEAAASVLIRQAKDIEAAAHQKVIDIIEKGVEERAAASKELTDQLKESIGERERAWLDEQAVFQAVAGEFIRVKELRIEASNQIIAATNDVAAALSDLGLEEQALAEVMGLTGLQFEAGVTGLEALESALLAAGVGGELLAKVMKDVGDRIEDANKLFGNFMNAIDPAIIEPGVSDVDIAKRGGIKNIKDQITEQMNLVASLGAQLSALTDPFADVNLRNTLLKRLEAAQGELGRLQSMGVSSFAGGGVVGGPSGSAQLAVLHGGERVIPSRNAKVGSGGMTVNINEPTIIGNDPVGAVAAFVTEGQRRGMLPAFEGA